MSEQIELPQLRPLARQGQAYYAELKAILKTEGYKIKQDFERIHRATGKITPSDIARLALAHQLNFKATTKYLERERLLPCGTYDRMRDGGIRPMTLLKDIWKEMQAEEMPEWKRQLEQVTIKTLSGE